MLLFFFQAEDGIRDGRVTGVQTCALPIYRADLRPHPGGDVVLPHVALGSVVRAAGVARCDVQDVVDRVDDALVGQEPGRLAGDALPARTAVDAAVDRVGLVRDAHVDALGQVAGGAGRL